MVLWTNKQYYQTPNQTNQNKENKIKINEIRKRKDVIKWSNKIKRNIRESSGNPCRKGKKKKNRENTEEILWHIWPTKIKSRVHDQSK